MARYYGAVFFKLEVSIIGALGDSGSRDAGEFFDGEAGKIGIDEGGYLLPVLCLSAAHIWRGNY